MFYLVCPSPKFRTQLIEHLKKNNIHAVFHYLSLHSSPYYKPKYTGNQLPQSDYYSDCLVRLPLYFDLTEVEDICETINNFNQR